MPVQSRTDRTLSLWSIIIGSLVTVIAIIVAVVPVKTSQLNYPTCGSALFRRGGGNFQSSNSLWDTLDNSYYDSLCDKEILPMRVTAITLAVIGIALLIFGIVRRTQTVSTVAVAAPAGGATASIAAQLQQVADLHASGTLSDIEFESAKRKILGSAPQDPRV